MTGASRPMRSLAMAAVRCVLPLPVGPMKTSHPAGSAANFRAAS